MQRTSSPIPHTLRTYSTGSHGSYDQESVDMGSGGMDTSFELMSATQLRDQLRKEQYRRKESQAEVDVLKSAAHSFLDTPKHQSLPALRTYEYQSPSNGYDSDSGISHTLSGSRLKSPFGLNLTASAHLRNTSQHLIFKTSAITPQAEEPWSLLPASGAIKDMQDAVYESEQRRLVLVEKLREAHETLQVQTQHLCDSEAKLNDSQYAIENMSTSNQFLQRKLSSLQRDREDARADKMETIRIRQVHEDKMEGLDHDLKNLRLAYSALQSEQQKRDQIVEQTSRALSLVEGENHKLQQTRESMLKEAIALRESLHMSKAKCDKLEADIKDLDQVRQDCEIMMSCNSQLNSQLQECKQIRTELENENELLKGDFRKAREEREVYQNRAIQLEEKCSDLNAKCVSSAAAKEKLLQEKLDLQQLLNQSNYEREQVSKIKQLLENQITDMHLEVTQSKLAAETTEEDIEKITEELNAVKKVSEVLSTELATAKQNLEKLQKEMRQLTSDKRTSQQQQAFWKEEAKRLSSDKEALNKTNEQQKEEFAKERDQMSEQHQLIRENLKEMRVEKSKSQSRCQELEAMLHRANDEIETSSIRHQEEVAEGQASCEHLTASIGRKDNDIAMLTEQLQDAQEQVTQFKAELQTNQCKHEQLLEEQDEMDRLREENKRLTQEHGEDLQVIHLLEMQKNILTKNQSSTQLRQTTDQLQAQVDHLKAELGLAEDKFLETKEELARERSQAGDHNGYGMSLSCSARSTPALCENCQLLHDQVDKLKEINKIFTDKIKKFETDNVNHKMRAKTLSEMESKCLDLQAQIEYLNHINSLLSDKVARLQREKDDIMQNVPAPEEVINRYEYTQLERDKDRLRADYINLKEDYANIKEDYSSLKSTFSELQVLHQQLIAERVIKTLKSPREERERLQNGVRKTQTENKSLQRQIDLLRSQALIAQNAKMRAEDRIRILEKELQYMQRSVDRQKSRHSFVSPDVEASLKSQLDERNQVIQQLQSEIASKNIAMENARQGVDNRVLYKIRELDNVIQERDDLDEIRRKSDQQKIALEIKLEEQRLIIEHLRDEKPRLIQQKDAEIDRLDRQKMKLENDLRNMKEQLSEKDGELLRLQMKQGSGLDNLQEEAAKQIQELQALTLRKEAEIGHLQEQTYEKEKQCQKFSSSKSKFDLELKQMQMEAARKTQHLTKIVQRQEGEITSFREDISRKNDLLRTTKQNQEFEVGNLKDELSETTREFTLYKESKDSELSHMRNQLLRKDEDYERTTERKEEQMLSLEKELEDVTQESPLIKQTLQRVEQELASAKDELQGVNSMLSVKEAQILEQNRKLQLAEMKHDEAVRDRNEQRRMMQKDLDEREDNITELQRQLDVVKSEISILQNQTGDKTKRLEETIQSQEEEIDSFSKQTRELKNININLTEEKQTELRKIEKLKVEGEGKCSKCERVSAEKEELSQERDSFEEEVEELQQEVDRLESLLNVYQQDSKASEPKAKDIKKAPVKEDLLTPTKRSLVDAAKPLSIISSPSSRLSSRSGSPALHTSTVNPMKLAAAMKRLSLKPTDTQKRAAFSSPANEPRQLSSKKSGIIFDRGQNDLEVTPTVSANSSRRTSSASLDQADRQRGLSPEPSANFEKGLRQSVHDMPKKSYQEGNRTSLNDLEARLKSLQSSSKARKPTFDLSRDTSPSGDAKKKTKFVLPSRIMLDDIVLRLQAVGSAAHSWLRSSSGLTGWGSSEPKAKDIKKTPVKEDLLTPTKRSLVDAAKPSSIISSPSSRPSSRSGSPALHTSTVNPMKLAAAMKRLSLKPTDTQKRTAFSSPANKPRQLSSKDSGITFDRGQNDLEVSPTVSTNSSRRSSSASLDQADRQRGLSPEPSANFEKGLRQSVHDMPKKSYQEGNRTSLNDLEARLKSLQSSSKARKPTFDLSRDTNPSGDAKKKTKFVLPSSKKFDKISKI